MLQRSSGSGSERLRMIIGSIYRRAISQGKVERESRHTFGNSDMIIDFGIVLMIDPRASR